MAWIYSDKVPNEKQGFLDLASISMEDIPTLEWLSQKISLLGSRYHLNSGLEKLRQVIENFIKNVPEADIGNLELSKGLKQGFQNAISDITDLPSGKMNAFTELLYKAIEPDLTRRAEPWAPKKEVLLPGEQQFSPEEERTIEEAKEILELSFADWKNVIRIDIGNKHQEFPRDVDIERFGEGDLVRFEITLVNGVKVSFKDYADIPVYPSTIKLFGPDGNYQETLNTKKL